MSFWIIMLVRHLGIRGFPAKTENAMSSKLHATRLRIQSDRNGQQDVAHGRHQAPEHSSLLSAQQIVGAAHQDEEAQLHGEGRGLSPLLIINNFMSYIDVV